MALEQELHLFCPYFKFRYEGFPLFVEALQVVPPNHPLAASTSELYVPPVHKSHWVVTRAKALAVVRMGTKRFSRFRCLLYQVVQVVWQIAPAE